MLDKVLEHPEPQLQQPGMETGPLVEVQVLPTVEELLLRLGTMDKTSLTEPAARGPLTYIDYKRWGVNNMLEALHNE